MDLLVESISSLDNLTFSNEKLISSIYFFAEASYSPLVEINTPIPLAVIYLDIILYSIIATFISSSSMDIFSDYIFPSLVDVSYSRISMEILAEESSYSFTSTYYLLSSMVPLV